MQLTAVQSSIFTTSKTASKVTASPTFTSRTIGGGVTNISEGGSFPSTHSGVTWSDTSPAGRSNAVTP